MLRGVTIWRHRAIFQLFTPTELWKLQNRLLCWKLILQWIWGEKTKRMFDTLFRLFPHCLNVITNLWCYKTPNIHRIDLTTSCISNAHNSHTWCHCVSNILTEFSLIIFLETTLNSHWCLLSGSKFYFKRSLLHYCCLSSKLWYKLFHLLCALLYQNVCASFLAKTDWSTECWQIMTQSIDIPWIIHVTWRLLS